jgi:competence protein ComEA
MPKSNIIVSVVAAGLAIVSVSLFFILLDGDAAPPIVIEDVPSKIEIAVSIEGAVATPGVYRLTSDARLADAVEMAGGFTPDADVADLNMASRLHDEQQIVIPSKSGAPNGSPFALPASAADQSSSGLININTASASQLEELPGIGPVLAERIVAYREANGPFARVEELARVEGISPAMVEEMRDQITVVP